MFKPVLIATLLILSCSLLVAAVRLTPIENFDSGDVTLSSWADEDLNPTSWSLESGTPDGSPYCLRLFGNTWKFQQITPHAVDSVGVIQLQAKTTSNGKIQGIGFSDGFHQLFYSFSGTTIVNIEAWVPVYQGAFSAGVWNTYQLPLASDWLAFFDYLPVISGIIYVNDMDGVSTRSVYFDAIVDISTDLPVPPRVSIAASPPTLAKNVGINFTSTVTDPDSDTFTYEWNFGDSATSNLANPYHLYTTAATHTYTVTLKVTDSSNQSGYASTEVTIDQGANTLPITLNFVGDIMLARRYEETGGIIPTQGVNAIFLPTKPLLGDAADISVANLEVVLANTGTPHPTKSVKYRGNPANVSGLVYAGIDVVSTANNHTLDYGLTALQQMSGLLNTNNILFSGSGANTDEAYEPTFINRRGLNIAFLRSCDRTGQYNDAQPYLQAGFNKPGFAYMTPYYVSQQLQAVEEVADLKIVEMHGGSEYSLTPGSGYDKGNPFINDTQDEDYDYRSDVPHQWDIEIRHNAIDSGADLVIVHHPHIIQGLEVYHNKLIAHSLGNFAFDLDYPETMPSMILYADAYPQGFQNYRVKPVYINNYIPLPATGQLGIYILDYLAQQSRQLNTRLWVDRIALEARVLLDDDNPVITSSVFETMQQLNDHLNSQNLTAPVKLPRRGSISEISNVEPLTNTLIRLGQETIWYGNFEDEGSTLWSPPQYSATVAWDGARSAMLTTTTSTNVISALAQKCKLYDNTRPLTLHGWIKTQQAGTANINIRYYNARTNSYLIGTESVAGTITGTSDWTYYYKELNVPANAYYYDLQLSLTGTTGAATAWFDNVGLIEWTDWASAAAFAIVPYPNNYYYLQAKTSDGAKSLKLSLVEKDFSSQPALRKSTPPIASPSLEISPNPFNPNTTIYLDLPVAGLSTLRIYNFKGQLVKELAKEDLPAGTHRFTWDSRDKNNASVASGIYFIKLDNGGKSAIRKAVLLK